MTGKLSRGVRAHFQPARIARDGEHGWLTEQLGETILQEVSSSIGEWEVELGFGKGRYLLQRAATDPQQRLMGIELVSQYFRLVSERAHRRGLDQLVLLQGEALFLLATWLPARFAHTIHIYFPDPWPKAKHHRRRLFDEETVDLLLRALTPDGKIVFATDHQLYGARVLEVLQGHPGVELEMIDSVWPDGARTNYEEKYIVEGRKILRFNARPSLVSAVDPQDAALELLHPLGRETLLVAGSPTRSASSDPLMSESQTGESQTGESQPSS